MGSVQAAEMAELLEIESAIAWHLKANHYPPIPETMVKPCLEAIDNANLGLWHNEVELPKGVWYKGRNTAPTWAMIEQHHLDTWVELDEDGLWED